MVLRVVTIKYTVNPSSTYQGIASSLDEKCSIKTDLREMRTME